MSALFEELAYSVTPMGELSLRRRKELTLGEDVYEIKLGDEFLMSSLFTKAEEELARLGLAELDKEDLDVVVGGLGLGYTARETLKNDCVGDLLVVETMKEVIDWHRQEILPLGKELNKDKRCHLVEGDFFKMARTDGFDPDQPGRQFDAVLLDIDHSPDDILHDSHSGFYTPEGLRGLKKFLRPGGVFALWSNDPPHEGFTDLLCGAFQNVEAQVVEFDNPLQNMTSRNTVYVARNQV